MVTPSSLEITKRGRVTLAISDTPCGNQCDQFYAPEYRPGLQVNSETSIEKVGITWSNYSVQFVYWLDWTPRHTFSIRDGTCFHTTETHARVTGNVFVLRFPKLNAWTMNVVLTRQEMCVLHNIEERSLLYPLRIRWGTYLRCCSQEWRSSELRLRRGFGQAAHSQ